MALAVPQPDLSLWASALEDPGAKAQSFFLCLFGTTEVVP
jgi:hypothetical protein